MHDERSEEAIGVESGEKERVYARTPRVERRSYEPESAQSEGTGGHRSL